MKYKIFALNYVKVVEDKYLCRETRYQGYCLFQKRTYRGSGSFRENGLGRCLPYEMAQASIEDAQKQLLRAISTLEATIKEGQADPTIQESDINDAKQAIIDGQKELQNK